MPDLAVLRLRFRSQETPIPKVAVELVPLTAYDELASVGISPVNANAGDVA